MAKRIEPVAYDNESTYRSDMTTADGFTATTPFLVLCNIPIPSDSRFYFETTITEDERNPIYRYMPLYFGVHKEPSFGVFNSDFCLGSVYYTRRQQVETFERYNAEGYARHYIVDETFARTPIVGTVIGVAVDMPLNTISIYSDGELYYSFSPRTFIMAEEGEFYFAVASRVFDNISGLINYGKYPMKYKPEGYWTLNEFYQDKYSYTQDIYGYIQYSSGDSNKDDYYENRVGIGFDFDATHVIENPYAPMDDPHYRATYLLPNREGMYIEGYEEKPEMVRIDSSYTSPKDIASLIWPCPWEVPIYFELNVQECHMREDALGIPISVGVCRPINDSQAISFRIHLWHERYKRFKTTITLNGKENNWEDLMPTSPTEPNQPDTIGVLMDLPNQRIAIYTDNQLFMEAKLDDYIVIGRDDSENQLTPFTDEEKEQIHFNDRFGLNWIFIQAEPDAFDSDGRVTVNTGDTTKNNPLEFDVPEGAMSYWYYYNSSIRYLAKGDLDCTITVLPYYISVSRSFICTLYVQNKYLNMVGFTPGLNMMYGTYNTISDEDAEVNPPDISVYELKKLMRENK